MGGKFTDREKVAIKGTTTIGVKASAGGIGALLDCSSMPGSCSTTAAPSNVSLASLVTLASETPAATTPAAKGKARAKGKAKAKARAQEPQTAKEKKDAARHLGFVTFMLFSFFHGASCFKKVLQETVQSLFVLNTASN